MEQVQSHNKEKIKENLWIMFSLVLITLICFFAKDYYNIPSALNDEIGYLADAAYFAGYDWNGIMADIPYYSFGYSLFLVPLFIVFTSGQYIYIGVWLINTLCLWISFLSLLYISKYLSKTLRWELRIIICLFICLNAYTISMNRYALAESMLFAVFCLMVSVAVKLLKRPGNRSVILLSLLTILIFIVHQRALSIVLATMILLLALLLSKRILLKQGVMFAITFAFFFVILLLIKNNLQNVLWREQGELANDFSVQISAATLLFSIDGIKSFIYALISKTFAIGAAYFLLPFCFMIGFFKRGLQLLKHKFNDMQEKDFLYFYLGISIIFALGVSAVFSMYPIRRDQIIYTRYNEYVVGPIILCVVIDLYNNKIKYKWNELAVYVCILSGLAFFTDRASKWMEGTGYISLTTPMLSLFYRNNSINMYAIATTMLIVFGVLYFLGYRKKMLYFILPLLTGVSIYSGIYTNQIFNHQDEARKATQEIAEVINDMYDSDKEIQLKLVRAGGAYMQQYYGGILQSALPRVNMKYINLPVEKTDLENADLVVLFNNSIEILDGITMDMENIYSNNLYTLLEIK